MEIDEKLNSISEMQDIYIYSFMIKTIKANCIPDVLMIQQLETYCIHDLTNDNPSFSLSGWHALLQ